MEASSRPPEGTIALLFTDIEGSTQLAARAGAEWPDVLARHHALVGDAIAAEGGHVDGTEGDAFFATFVEAAAATRAAVAAQRALRAQRWPAEIGELAVRMGLHVGHVERRATGYVGLEVHRAARVAAAAHGGQLLLTGAARALIGDAISVEPVGMHRLKDFPSPEPLFCAVIDGRGAAAFPPPRTQELRPTNLPPGSPALVGREHDLERIRVALIDEGERAITLTGRGGAGKTSLALLAAGTLLDAHSGGTWLVRLATVTSPDDVLPAIAATIGAGGDVSGSPESVVVARLRDRGPVLVVLDNMEHLLGAAPALSALLDAVPELRLLITSQAPVRLAAERCLPLDALDEVAALELIERVAGRRGATVTTRGPDREALTDVINLLDGLPLGLELAAARLRLLSPSQLRDRLRESFDVLRDATADRPERQRSLRATVEWTLGLLADDPRSLFVRTGAFAGPAELEDLEAVAGGDGLDVLDALAGLLDVALVRRVESGDGRMRFGLPEALRQIAVEMLDAGNDGHEWRRAHARHHYDLVWAARTVTVPAGVFRAAVAADAEAALALRWARETGDPLAAPLAAARGIVLADVGQCREALAALEPLLDQPSGEASVDAVALAGHAAAMTVLARVPEALASAQRAVELADDVETTTLALLMRGVVETYAGDREASVHDCARAAALSRDLDAAALAGARLYEAQACIFAGELDRAAELIAEVRRVGTPVDAKALWHLDTLEGDLAVQSGRPREALEHQARSLEAAQARGDHLQVFHDLWGIADTLGLLEEDAGALEVAGLAEAEGHDVRGPAAHSSDHVVGVAGVVAAEGRVGPALAEELRSRGRAVAAGNRVLVACQWARVREAA